MQLKTWDPQLCMRVQPLLCCLTRVVGLLV
jgi:hypothetical protein